MKKLMVGVAFLASTGAVMAATYYGRPKGGNAAIQNFVSWWDAQTGGNQVSVTPTANDGNVYVFVNGTNDKVTGGNFPGKAYFGADGSTVGDTAAQFTAYASKSKLTMADCTLVSGYFNINDGPDAMAFGGHYHIPANGSFSARAFKPSASGAVASRNFTIAADAVFTGDLTGVFHFVVDRSNNCAPIFTVSGDMSGYAGTLQTDAPSRLSGTSGVLQSRMLLTSASAFGDTSVANTAAVKLQDKCYLKVNEAVNQGTSRGVTCDLSKGQACGVYADGTDAWTLSAPVYGSVGSFEKIGTGTVTLDGAMQPSSLVAKEGTLILGDGLAFAGNATITVKSGATLRILKMPSNASIAPEEGATVEMGLPTIAFDGTDTEPVQLTASEWALFEQYCPDGVKVTLSQTIVIPFSDEKRLPVVKIAGGNADVAMFVDATAKTDDLPRTSFVSETVDNVQTIYLVARPAIDYTAATSKSLLDKANWSSGALPESGCDYRKPGPVGNGLSRTGSGSSIKEYIFAGDSLTVCGKEIWNYAGDFYVPELVIRGSSGVLSSSGNQGTYRNKKIRGMIRPVNNGTTEAATLTYQLAESMDIQATICGDGRLKILSQVDSPAVLARISGDNSGFTGRLVLGLSEANHAMNLVVTNASALGGAMAAATEDGVTFAATGVTDCSRVSLTAADDVVFNAANRGWKADYLTLAAEDGKKLSLAVPTFAVSGALAKGGAGTVSLATPLVGDGIATVPVAVKEGFVKAGNASAWQAAAFTVADGAGFEVDLSTDDAELRKYGVRAASVVAETDALIAVKGVLASPDLAKSQVLEAAICTVPVSNADLSDIWRAMRVPHHSSTVQKNELTGEDAGFVTYVLHAEPSGFMVIVR